ncbi:MAG: hypothetical protein JXA37_04145 [Chloroflexia bacterium]|nr:hypothetical protein [Chloroflexia bacterium]
MSEAVVGTYTESITEARTVSWSHIETVSPLVRKDIEALAHDLNLNLLDSLGRDKYGASNNTALARALCDDLNYMLQNRCVFQFCFIFYRKYSPTEGGLPLTYRAYYRTWSPPANMRWGEGITDRHTPLDLPNVHIRGKFGIVVDWSDLFLQSWSESQRRNALVQLRFNWVPAPKFYEGNLGMEREQIAYGVQQSAFALRRSVQFPR